MDNKFFKRISVRIPIHLYDRMKNHSERLGLSISSYICCCIGEKLISYEGDKKINNNTEDVVFKLYE